MFALVAQRALHGDELDVPREKRTEDFDVRVIFRSERYFGRLRARAEGQDERFPGRFELGRDLTAEAELARKVSLAARNARAKREHGSQRFVAAIGLKDEVGSVDMTQHAHVLLTGPDGHRGFAQHRENQVVAAQIRRVDDTPKSLEAPGFQPYCLKANHKRLCTILV
ncbi:MAG TPA: hypothetical protein VGP41_00625 [Candidatus Lustribacter sp.]|nr:hypothetical protein [Candidatus Lustribacter sp.]